MAMKTKTPDIIPTPGYILCQPYLPKNVTFVSGKEASGEDHKYEVLAVGESITDSEGILRKAPCKVGDIIIGIDSNSVVEVEFMKYIFLHFTQVHGIWKTTKK